MMRVPEISGTARGAVMADAKWPVGSRITIAFLDDDHGIKERVKAAAQHWIGATGADLSFSWLDDPASADIRISFSYSGSWSLLGRYCQKETDPSVATMNFGWLTAESTDGEVAEVVLHEFGHALGFIHEHQNPDGGIEWNREVVLDELSGPPNNWDPETIERNVLGSYDPRDLIGTPFDADSIMLYPFPGSWTKSGEGTKANSVLSPSDIELARRIYT